MKKKPLTLEDAATLVSKLTFTMHFTTKGWQARPHCPFCRALSSGWVGMWPTASLAIENAQGRLTAHLRDSHSVESQR